MSRRHSRRARIVVFNSIDQIVITGVGLITPLGLSLQQTWDAVLRGQCGMGPMPAMESPLPAGATGGQAPDLPADFAPQLGRESRYLRRAVLDAMKDAGLSGQLPCTSDRAGLLLGTTLHGMRAGGDFFRRSDLAALKDFLAGSVIQNACGDLPFAGCAMTTCSACSSSLGAIVMAVTLLRSGRLDLVVAGGYDTISEYVYGGFNSLRLVSPEPPRPFTRGRQGMKLAEGYGIVVLERASDAAGRGARAMATILGYGESADAHHLTQPHPQGDGAARAMQQALAAAGLTPSDIDLAAAHGTGTPDNDVSEFAALSRVFGSDLSRVPVVAFKSHLGHTLGGAGAVELILAAKAMREQMVPACANVTSDELEFAGLNVATGSPRPSRIRATLNTSLGFGGANTCVVLGPPPSRELHQSDNPLLPPLAASRTNGRSDSIPSAARPFVREAASGGSHGDNRFSSEVLITGVGIVLPGAVGNEAFLRQLADRADIVGGDIAESDIAQLLNARRVRRMSQYVKLSLAAAMLCLRDAGIEDFAPYSENCAAVLGTTHGSTNYCEQYYGQIVREGIAAANPMLFAEGVPNAAAAHLSLMLSLRGPCQTVIGTRTAGLDAIRLAAARIAAGEWQRAIVGAAEEFSPTVNAAHARWRRNGTDPVVAGAGAVTLLLESRPAMESRGGRSRGRIDAAAGGLAPPGGLRRLIRHAIRQIGAPPIGLGASRGNRWASDAGTADCYSVRPLAAIAVRLLGNDVGRFGAIATDPSGAVSAVAIDRSAD
jgi:3-oxoacyl-[acyl-carrier-protein] synthase II